MSRAKFNQLAAKYPVLESLKKHALVPIDHALHRNEISIIESLGVFVPNSAASRDVSAHLTLQAAGQTFPFLAGLLAAVGDQPLPLPIPIETFADTTEKKSAAQALKVLLDKHGSDKAARHNYHNLYGSILAMAGDKPDTFEVGLGTNNTDVASNMGAQGRPGASLRAFSEFRPQARVYGADVDKRILFQEGSIKTFYVDQTNPETFDAIGSAIDHDFDLIIDDGLHSPNANIATMTFALPRLKSGGWFVVEDIGGLALPVWQVVSKLLPQNFQSWIIASDAALMFAVKSR